MLGHREEFDKFVKNFVEKRKAWSKVLTRSRGDHIVACLKGAATDAQFKFLVKSRGFQAMDYPALNGLRKVLCLSAKSRVIACLEKLILANQSHHYTCRMNCLGAFSG